MKLLPSLRVARPRRDLFAALTLAALAIPEQLATARLAGLPAAQGVVVFAAVAIVMALIARDRALSVGADSSIAPTIAAALVLTAAPGSAAMIALLTGCILCAIALFRMQGIARLLSLPVAAGMMTGIAIHILAGRLPTVLGMEIAPTNPVATFGAVWSHVGSAQPGPLGLAALVVAVCTAGHAWNPRMPAPLLAIALTMALAAWLDPNATWLARSAGVGETWGLALPLLPPYAVLQLFPSALVVAFLCLFQTTVVLREGDADAPELRRNALGAVGLANLASAAIGGFAVNSSPPRTQILRDAGATSQAAGFGAAAIGLLVLLLAPGLLQLLPAAALAGVLVFVALRIVPFATFRRLLARSPLEAAIAFATLVLVTVLPLPFGLPLAMLLSLMHATLPLFATQVAEFTRIPNTTIWWHRPGAESEPRDDAVMVLGLSSPLNFANAEGIAFEIRALVARRPRPPRLLVLECAGLLSLDITGADLLSTMIVELRDEGTKVALARVEAKRARDQLARSGVIDVLGADHLFDSVNEALTALTSRPPSDLS